MDVRPYWPADREACLAIFDSVGSPIGFQERASFERFLERPEGPYFVMEQDGAVMACGGFEIAPEAGLATLVWGMVRRDVQKQGLGRFLLMYRLREIGKLGGVQQVRVEVLREVAGFFEGQGFKAAGVVGERVELVKKLTVCA
jgi:N-acetylglutamate synthase-like GNAT family acetyltransferase